MESRRRGELDDEAIGNLLEDSDIGDFVPSDDDFDDPEFVRPESSMSSTEEESDGPDISTSFIQARGKTRRGTRGVPRGRSRGRSRGRTRNSTGSRRDNIQ
ncbi:unnamed protein product [Parnassius apollo]|uniref:(apollo) hypothetical protein n=1 Tax=Parnassius apollo TaxID=110799 RepID=A0A8S3VY95_PARAO|nr:unnamed protein product [Parnassius apollo]